MFLFNIKPSTLSREPILFLYGTTVVIIKMNNKLKSYDNAIKPGKQYLIKHFIENNTVISNSVITHQIIIILINFFCIIHYNYIIKMSNLLI